MRVFINRHGELRAGWATASAIAVMIAAQLIARPLSELGDENNPSFKLGVTLVYGIIAVAGILLLFRLLYKRGFRELGMVPEKGLPAFLRGLAGGAVSVAVILAFLVVIDQAAIINTDVDKLISLSVAAEFVSVCVFMFSEELLARGFFMTAMKTTRNKWAILFVPAAIFALLHLMNDGVTVLSIINTLIAGTLLGYMFMKSGALWLSTGFHIAWNFFMGDIFGLGTSGTANTHSVLTTQLGTNTLLTGSYGPEDSVLCALVLLLACLAVQLFIKNPNHPAWTLESGLPLTRG
ncbi:MAG: CPBP family intramembrane metalloprotease [Clostridiales bacterium]|jgi:membrane protease YdiL (CAAX protease family)|nr:CPBP family intramembrane metalloprotease [Clostridiales bacterium]